MIVLTDVDGVLADFVGGLCSALELRGFPRSPASIQHWDLSLSLSPEELREAHDAMSTPGFCYGLSWSEGARFFLHRLEGLAEVHAVTAPFRNGATWMQERMSWLSTDIHVERVHFVNGKYKHLVRGDVLIEDHPETAYAWCEAHPNGVALLLDQPWNRPGSAEWRAHRNMYRVESFARALEIVEGL
jgi:5'(3')-deoxyribonucleotidase